MVVISFVFFYHSAIFLFNKQMVRKEKSFHTIQSSWKIKKHRAAKKSSQYQRRILKKKDFQLFIYFILTYLFVGVFFCGFIHSFNIFIFFIILYMRYNSEVKHSIYMLVSSAWRIKKFKKQCKGKTLCSHYY